MSQHFGNIDIKKKALQEIFEHGHIPQNSEVWSGMDPTGVYCIAELNAARIESYPVARQKLADIIFAILAHLNRLARHDPGAAGVANSIWHSLRVDYVEGSDLELPDTVCDDLFARSEVLLDSFRTLQLHKGPGNTYLQTWFIDRIMRHGTLWIGKYTRVHMSMLSGPVPDRPRDSAIPSLPHQNIGEGSHRKSMGTDECQASSSSGQPHSDGTISSHWKGKSILDRQEDRRIYSQLIEFAAFSCFGSGPVSNVINAASFVYLEDVRSRFIWNAETDEARAQELVSVFDVDGPCVIATPFNAEWETLPHPALRSMSTCWVVEKLDRHAYGRVPVVLCPESKGKGKEKETLLNKDPGPEELSADEDTPLYKVVTKVKGLWQLMDFPYGEVLFI